MTDRSSWGVHWAAPRMNVKFTCTLSPPSLILFLLSLWLLRRPRRTLLLWTGASSWSKRSWIELRKDSLLLCRNWRRQRRLQMRARGVCGLDLNEPSPKHWIIETNSCILSDTSSSVTQGCIPVVICSTALTHQRLSCLMQYGWFKPGSRSHFLQ